MSHVKSFIVAFTAFLVLDFLWLGFVVKDFNMRHLAEIGRIKDGALQINYGAALVVYILLALSVVFFIIPRIENLNSWGQVFLWGAFFGIIVYGVFDMTNLSILKNYALVFAIADMAWGGLVYGLVTVITKWARG